MDKHILLKSKSPELKEFNKAKGILYQLNPEATRITDDQVVSEACKVFTRDYDDRTKPKQ